MTAPAPSGTALVTGASSGIGRDIARDLARRRFDLVITARRVAELEQLARELRAAHGIQVHVKPGCLSEAGFPHRLHEELDRDGIVVDTLVNNAGFSVMAPFLDSDLDVVMEMLQVNMASLTTLTYLFGNDMRGRGRGRIMNVASVGGFTPAPLLACYYATKSYVISFTRALHEELRGTGVTVTVLCPGVTGTEFNARGGIAETWTQRRVELKPDRVARVGVRGMLRGKAIVVPGTRYWLTAVTLRRLPLGLATRIAGISTRFAWRP